MDSNWDFQNSNEWNSCGTAPKAGVELTVSREVHKLDQAAQAKLYRYNTNFLTKGE